MDATTSTDGSAKSNGNTKSKGSENMMVTLFDYGIKLVLALIAIYILASVVQKFV